MIVRPHRTHPLWFAFLLHRISGVVLALFLPVHFFVLSLALHHRGAFEGFLTWSNLPLVKVSEMALVFLLSAHLFGGLRLLALEFLPWSPRQKTFAAAVCAAAVLVAVGFLLNAV